jgi:hypothetical protein
MLAACLQELQDQPVRYSLIPSNHLQYPIRGDLKRILFLLLQ